MCPFACHVCVFGCLFGCVFLPGVSEVDYSLYPSRELQMQWLHIYLQAYKRFTKKGEEVTECEIETLYVQINKFALVSLQSFFYRACTLPSLSHRTLPISI